MAQSFKKGDVVVLKSGGPLMTVHNIGNYTMVENGALCIWFEGAKRHEAVFDLEAIKIYSEHDD